MQWHIQSFAQKLLIWIYKTFCLLICLTTLSVAQTDTQHRKMRWLWNWNEKSQKRWSWPTLRRFPGFCMQGLKRAIKILTEDIHMVQTDVDCFTLSKTKTGLMQAIACLKYTLFQKRSFGFHTSRWLLCCFISHFFILFLTGLPSSPASRRLSMR